MTRKAPIHVLIVDDSAVVRHTVSLLLRPADGWRVSVAPDPIVALERIRVDAPDVILLDLEMPRMDGMTFLRHLMALQPIPVVVCSGYAGHGTKLALSALEVGAVEIFPKPRLAVKATLQESGASLTSVLRRAAAAGPSLQRAWRPTDRNAGTSPIVAPGPGGGGRAGRPILLGASMGGPEAIRHLVGQFPADGPACVIVQHMPERFTTEFARRLDGMAAMEIREAADGDPLHRGRVLIAPGGRHLIIDSTSAGPVVRLTDTPPVQGHRPSVDVLFQSAARSLRSGAVGAVLTGMGEDGADGLLALSRAGARTVVQDRASCTVFGMPGAALSRGGAQRTVSLKRMSRVLLDLADGREASQSDGAGATKPDCGSGDSSRMAAEDRS